MRRMIPQNQQEVLKKLSEKKQFLQDVTITGNVNEYYCVIDSDGISYFTISGSAYIITSGVEEIEITGIPNGLETAFNYPATNDLGTSGHVTTSKIADNVWKIMFNSGQAGRTVYFSVMFAQATISL